MQLFRHLGLMIAVFWCAAMVVAPMAAAAGAGQDTNHGPQGMGPGQEGPGQESENGNGLFRQGGQAGNAGPGQGGRMQGMPRGNMSAMNMTNMTLPEKPDRDPDNSTAMNMTGWHGNRPGNITPFNMTNRTLPEKPDWNPANITAVNQSRHDHGDGDLTPPGEPGRQGVGNGQGWQGNGEPQQADSRNGSGDSLIGELIGWLEAHGVS